MYTSTDLKAGRLLLKVSAMGWEMFIVNLIGHRMIKIWDTDRGDCVRYRCNCEDVSREVEQVEKITMTIDGINPRGVGVSDRINMKKRES